MEICVNEYIRTNSGTIAKLKRIEFDTVDKDLKWYFYDKKEPDINIVKEWCINKPYIVKHSSDIKDLVQAGDIVTYKLYQFSKFTDIALVKEYTDARTQEKYLGVNGFKIKDSHIEIKEILAKEQFNQMKYIVGEQK